jgi:hypothetical protein
MRIQVSNDGRAHHRHDLPKARMTGHPGSHHGPLLRGRRDDRLPRGRHRDRGGGPPEKRQPSLDTMRQLVVLVVAGFGVIALSLALGLLLAHLMAATTP